MNMDAKQQLEVNMAAAILLRRLSPHVWQCAAIGSKLVRYECKCGAYRKVHSEEDLPSDELCTDVDIFTNAQDLIDVVIALGVSHGYQFYYSKTHKKWRVGSFAIRMFNSYQEAVVAALMEVQDDND